MKTKGFIDIHNHGAWGIDDGISCKQEAKRLLQQASQDGVTNIILTPHGSSETTKTAFQAQLQRMKEFQTLAKNYAIQAYTGNEIYVNQTLIENIPIYPFQTLAESMYILVEFDMYMDLSSCMEIENWLHELSILDYKIIIAHVERYFKQKLDIERVKRWHALGYYIQVNRTSCLGFHGKRNQDHARTLLDAGLVHVIASDAHRTEGMRICKMQDVYMYLSRKYGKTNADLLCIENGKHIIKNETLENMEKRPSLFRRWKTR